MQEQQSDQVRDKEGSHALKRYDKTPLGHRVWSMHTAPFYIRYIRGAYTTTMQSYKHTANFHFFLGTLLPSSSTTTTTHQKEKYI